MSLHITEISSKLSTSENHPEKMITSKKIKFDTAGK